LGTIQENLPENDGNVELPAAPPLGVVSARQALPPKGSCWYCEKPLDSVRRFCGKDCADSFDEEAEYTR
jgi:hypothetical protein